jgi:hypothetical protein
MQIDRYTFIPTPIHFNSVERALKESLHIAKKVSPEANTLWIGRIMDEMRKLNVLSVSLQHIEHLEGILDDRITSETHYLMTNKLSDRELSAVGLYKAIDCILMQIELDPIESIRPVSLEEREALTFLIKFKRELTVLIIETIPGFDDLPWEIES